MNVSSWQQRQQAAADTIRQKRNARTRELRRLTKLGLYTPKYRHTITSMGEHDVHNCRHAECIAERYTLIALENRLHAQERARLATAALERAHDDVEIPF